MSGLVDYLKTLFGERIEEMKDPEVEIEQAINAARARDRELRNQAAKVIAHKTQIADEIEDAAGELERARELAKQALLKSDEATRAGRTEDAERYNRSAQALAMRMQAAESNYESLKTQLEIAEEQADTAKRTVQQNAMELEEVAAKRMEMLGELESAKMQETLNRAMQSINATMDREGPSLSEVEDKIEARKAEARAQAELAAATPEGSIAELEREIGLAEADRMLDDLRADLGLSQKALTGGGQS
jgi:phage shock protein A